MAIFGILLLYLFIEKGLGITCPILFLTGISCAGCGMSRAYFSLLHLDIAAAFAFHPLFFLPPVALLCYLFRGRFSAKTRRLLLWGFLFLFLGVYILRMCNPNDTIVVFHPTDGLLYRLFCKFSGLSPLA